MPDQPTPPAPPAPAWHAPGGPAMPPAPQHAWAPATPAPPLHQFGGPAPGRRANGLGIASLVLGGVALLLSAIPILNVVGGIGALVGIVLGIIALTKRDRSRVTALIGVPLSAIAFVLSTALVVTYAVAFTGWVSALAEDDGAYSMIAPDPVVFEPGSDVPATGGLGSSPANPAPFGSTVEFRSAPGDAFTQGWTVVVGDPTVDAYAEVAAAYPLAHLEPGEQYASLPVTVTNRASTRATPAVQLKFEYVTSELRVIEKPWINMDGSLESIGGVDPGMTEGGEVVFVIPSSDAGEGVWGMRFYLSSQIVYFGDPAAG